MKLTFSEALLHGIDKKQEISSVAKPDGPKQGEIWIDLPDAPEQPMPSDWPQRQLQHRIGLLSQALQKLEAERRERIAVAVLSGLASSVEAHRRADGSIGARVLPASMAARIAATWADALIERLDSPPDPKQQEQAA